MHLAEDPEGVTDAGNNVYVVDQPLNWATLLNAALSCKTFLQPALDALWWSIDDIANLFLLLPTFKNFGLHDDTAYVNSHHTISFHTLMFFILGRFLMGRLPTTTGFVSTSMPGGFGICHTTTVGLL